MLQSPPTQNPGSALVYVCGVIVTLIKKLPARFVSSNSI